MNGKGSSPRPLSVSHAELSDRWAQTFGGRSAPWEQPDACKPLGPIATIFGIPVFADPSVPEGMMEVRSTPPA